MSDITKRLDAALEKAKQAIEGAQEVLKLDLHAHELPGGALTSPEQLGVGHDHALDDGSRTGPPVPISGDHMHTLAGGGLTGLSFEPKDEDDDESEDEDKSAHPRRRRKKPKKNDLMEGTLPVLSFADAESVVKRMRAGEPAGYLSKRSKVAKIDEPHVLVGDNKVWAIATQCGPVAIENFQDAGDYIHKAVDGETLVGKGYYLPLRPLVIFDPPMRLEKALGKRRELDLANDVVEPIDIQLQESTKIQTLIFSRAAFTKSEAVRWARDHDFNSSKVDVTEESIRLRQREPEDFQDGSFRTIELTAGVKAVIGVPKAGSKKSDSKPAEVAKSDDVVVTIIKRSTHDNEDGTEHFVMGVVLVPDETDAHGDFYNVDDVRNAAHSFMENGGIRKIMHDGKPIEGVVVLETFLTRTEEVHKDDSGSSTFPVGTWMMAMRITNQKLWKMVLNGEFTGFSMGGTAIRESLEDTPT